MNSFTKYKVQEQLKPSSLDGVSDDQIDDHWNLYCGYVAQVNKLNEELAQLAKDGQAGSLHFADRRRRYGFEYNGMILHEYYFGNLTSKKTELKGSDLKEAIKQTWNSFDAWLSDFANTGKTRGIGWAILYADSTTLQLTNNFIHEHQNGIIAGSAPILVMDVWEHAYMVDHNAGGRADYINAFIKNINWEVAEKRFDDIKSSQVTKRF